MTRGLRPHAGGRGRSKYGAAATVVDGVRFDSKREARRWSELLLLQRAGEIRALRRQVEFPLTAWTANLVGADVGRYIADFTYEAHGGTEARGVWRLVVEDAKGVRTPLYVWKARHFHAQYGVKIQEV